MLSLRAGGPDPGEVGKGGFPKDVMSWPRQQVGQEEGLRTQVEVDVSRSVFEDLKGVESVIHSWCGLAILSILDCINIQKRHLCGRLKTTQVNT